MLIEAQGIRIQCGRQEPRIWTDRCHSSLLIAFVFEGADCHAKWRAGDNHLERRRIPPGHVWIMPPGLHYDVQWRACADLIELHIQAAQIRDFSAELIVVPSAKRLEDYVQQEPVIGLLCHALRDHIRSGVSDDNHHTSTVGAALASFTLRAHFAPQRRWRRGDCLRDDELHRVERLIEKNLRERFSLAALAREAHLSPSHFCRKFKATTGSRPRDYFNLRRVLWAKARLEAGAESVSEVAYDMGVYDLGHFGRLFRKFLHASPRVFLSHGRKQLRPSESQSRQRPHGVNPDRIIG